MCYLRIQKLGHGKQNLSEFNLYLRIVLRG